MICALAGNQNSGKTTLFNLLTGANQHVGNFPGVTVDSKHGDLKGSDDITIVDLPGIYSLSPYSSEEQISRDFLLKADPDAIINIVDATNIERNLYLTMQLLQLGKPMVIALNMIDEVRASNWQIDIPEMEKSLGGVRIIPIAASKGEGAGELIKAIRALKTTPPPPKIDFCGGPVHRTLHAVAHLIEDHAAHLKLSPMFVATKLIEGDEPLRLSLGLTDNENDMIAHSVVEMETELQTDHKAAIADMRYTFIEELVKKTVVKSQENRSAVNSTKLDRILTNKYFGIPLFFAIMLLVFYLTFGVIGKFLSGLLTQGIDALSVTVGSFLSTNGVNPIVVSLVTDGIFAGVGGVLSFLPTIVVLFFFLSVLEDTGYMARVAFMMDKPLRKIGLSGRSIVPLLVGLGCTVPAIMATRIETSPRDRKIIAFLTPFISCSAKLPIYAAFTAVFFPDCGALVMMGLYLFGILLAVLASLIIKKISKGASSSPFVMELPNYRFPSAKSVVLLLWEKAKDFITRAFTIIFAASVIIWFLQSFDIRINPVSDGSASILASVGRLIAPIFTPVGFADWRITTSLITGFMAKEAVISTLSVLSGGAELSAALPALFTLRSSLSFLVFTLLYTPCIASVSTMKKEFGARASATLIIMTLVIAYAVSLVVYLIAGLFM